MHIYIVARATGEYIKARSRPGTQTNKLEFGVPVWNISVTKECQGHFELFICLNCDLLRLAELDQQFFSKYSLWCKYLNQKSLLGSQDCIYLIYIYTYQKQIYLFKLQEITTIGSRLDRADKSASLFDQDEFWNTQYSTVLELQIINFLFQL